MTESARRETEFIRQEKLRLDKNIMEIQKQLSAVASNNETADLEINDLEEEVERMKKKSYKLNLKMKDIGYYLNEIIIAMEKVGPCKDEDEWSDKLKKIYQHFYVERSVEALIEKEKKNEPQLDEAFIKEKNEKMKIQQSKILSEL